MFSLKSPSESQIPSFIDRNQIQNQIQNKNKDQIQKKNKDQIQIQIQNKNKDQIQNHFTWKREKLTAQDRCPILLNQFSLSNI